MKKIMNGVMAATLICGLSIGVTSCSDNNDDPVPAEKKNRLVQRKEVIDKSDTYYITDYGYDEQGRLTSYHRVGHNTALNEVVVYANTTYTYGDHVIIAKDMENLSFYYTLNDDGLIVKEVGNKTVDGVEKITHTSYFRYENGRMIEYEETDDKHLYSFQWENDNLINIWHDGNTGAGNKIEFTRSVQSVDYGYTNPTLSSIDEGLFIMGYFGKPSKHLESHRKTIMESSASSLYFDYDYTYTIADGHIVEMVENSTMISKVGTWENKTNKKITSTFTYEKY